MTTEPSPPSGDPAVLLARIAAKAEEIRLDAHMGRFGMLEYLIGMVVLEAESARQALRARGG